MLTQLAGLAVGASTAFLGIGLVQHKSMQVLLAVKWGLASCVLCYLALRETNQVEEHLKNQQLPPKPPDPNWEYVPESLGTLLHRQLLKLWPLVLFIVTATVVFLSSVYASQHAPR